MKNIIIFGRPGCGKGTLSKQLISEYGYEHISTGDIIREEIKDKTKLGLFAEKIINSGNFVPDDTVIEMVFNKIINSKNTNGFLFDGFPRNLNQAKRLDKFMFDRKTPIDILINVKVDEFIAMTRILNRAKIENRPDDTKEVFNTRNSIFKSETMPVLEHFRTRGKVHSVDGSKDAQHTLNQYKEIIDNIENGLLY